MKLYVITGTCSTSSERQILTSDIAVEDYSSYSVDLFFSEESRVNSADNIVILSESEKNELMSLLAGQNKYINIKRNDASRWLGVLDRANVKFEEITINLNPANNFAKFIVDTQSK